MSLSDLLVPPNPDGTGPTTADSTPRALALSQDASLGGATRTPGDSQSTLDSLLNAVGQAVQGAVVRTLAGTPQGQAAINQYKADQVAAYWQQYGPMLMIGLVVAIIYLAFRRR